MATTSDDGSQQKKELDKFKRRMIRAVARLMLQEKMPEQEMWEKLKTETGCDCELLWVRMRSVALKKLKRMLAAEDRVDVIAKLARMTVTDWLLFDLVLVHEKTDFIGMDIRRPKNAGALKPLTDLFSLVQKFDIEGLSGDELAEAWTNATLFYNSQGHHVSPMLLQKRWYQLKETTRNCFYQFWFSYRGNAKLFAKASMEFMPSMLQMAIARRYKVLVTSQFMEWDEMIQKGLIILSEEFDARLRPRKVQIDENAPDLELVEPVIETIDLEADSDTETNQSSTNTEKVAPLQAVVKTELIDEHFEAAHNLMTALARQEDEYAYESEPNDIDDNDEDSTVALFDDPIDNEDNIISPATDTENTSNNDATFGYENMAASDLSPDNGITTTNEKTSSDNDEMTSNVCGNDVEEFAVEGDGEQEDIINKTIDAMPQITSVVGNVDISDVNTLHKDIVSTINNSSSDDDVQLITFKQDLDVKPVISAIDDTTQETMVTVDTNSHDIPMVKTENIEELSVDDIINKTCETALEKLIDKPLSGASALNSAEVRTAESASPFGKLHSFLNLVDNGIELVDDGIAYVEEEMDDCNKTDKIKIENVVEDDSETDATEETTEDNAKIDLKLLMYPVVYTTKLDNMGVLEEPYQTVTDKLLLDTILAKSKPVSQKTVNFDDIKKDNEPINHCTSDEDEAYENIITNENRVKLSSYLLQKPRTRKYNSIVLCKNPDFNTRLKRLNVGFFSSPRNINLLKHCKPLTIDVSKAFEAKLVNGTVYLKPGEEGVRCEVGVTDAEHRQQASVVPTAMSVQSLIDNQMVNSIFTKPPSTTPKDPNEDILVAERNKVINLPDISQVRRKYQRLLTAEVIPIRNNTQYEAIRNNSTPTIVVDGSHSNNISITTSSIHCTPNETPTTKVVESSDVNINIDTSDARNVSIEDLTPQNVGVEKELNITKSLTEEKTEPSSNASGNSRRQSNLIEPKKKIYPMWKSREIRPSVSWLSKKTLLKPPIDDALLTTDALNKMLFLLAQEKDGRDEIIHKKSKELSRKCNKGAGYLAKKKGRPKKIISNQPTQVIVDDASNEDVQVVSDTIEENEPKDKPREVTCKTKICDDKRKTQQYCCWAKSKIEALRENKRGTRHGCPPLPCTCCCQNALQCLIIDRRRNRCLERACKSIESVVQQTYVIEDEVNVDPDNVSNSSVPQNVNITLENKPFRITLDSSDSDCADKKTAVPENPSPQAVEYIDDDCRDDAPPVGAVVSVSSSISSPKVDLQISPILENPVNVINQTLISATPPPLVSYSPIPVQKLPRFQYVARKPLKPVPKTYPNRIATNLNPCKCIVPISVDSPHRNIIIDGSTAMCPIHKSIIMPKVGLNERQLYLTAKQLSQKPSRSPIYLGKNKILLTNIKFPPELKGEIEPTSQSPLVKIIPTLPLPTGVQLVLKPNGELTYYVDPNIEIDPQKLVGLPEILEAVKKQLNSMEMLSANSATQADSITQSKEVVTLSDDETSASNNDKEKTQLDTTHNNDDISNTSECDVDTTDKIIKDSEESNSKEEQETIEPIDHNTNKTEEQRTDIISSEEQIEPNGGVSSSQPIATETNTRDNATSTLENDAQSNSENIASLVTETVDPSVTEVAEGNKDNGKAKNILSDLMEMSGISAEDVTPTPVVPTPTTEQVLVTAGKSNLSNTSEFSPIMSFSELKYACMKNGLFFKLDYETGSIVPINVCIKKNENNNSVAGKVPESVTIDLTDDDLSGDSSKSSKPSTSPRSLLIASQRSKKFKPIGNALPLKLFKSSHPSILRRSYESNAIIVRNLGPFKNVLNSNRLKRKQDFNAIAATIDMVDSDCPMEEEYLESWDSEGDSRKRKADTSDESSDEEPLSSVAKRMRADAKNVETSEQSVIREAVDMDTENLSESFDGDCEEEDPDDDCILGV